jgi:rod shape-determining protein MreC
VKDFLGSARFKVFVVIALVLLGLMIRTATNGGLATFTADAVSVVVSPVQKLSSKVSGFFTDVINSVASYGKTKAENETLKIQINEYQKKLVDYNQMLRENQQLMESYDLHKENPDLKIQPADIIAREPGQWFSTFTIDKGIVSGIKLNDAVITPDGLVGLVTQVLTTSSVVTTILDPSVLAGILISETGDTGVSSGDRKLQANGQIKINYLSKESTVSPGYIVVTSGLGGFFPKNIKVGTVLEVAKESSGMSLYAICKPMVDSLNIKSVFVITDFNGKSVTASSQSGAK